MDLHRLRSHHVRKKSPQQHRSNAVVRTPLRRWSEPPRGRMRHLGRLRVYAPQVHVKFTEESTGDIRFRRHVPSGDKRLGQRENVRQQISFGLSLQYCTFVSTDPSRAVKYQVPDVDVL